jgi:hypothetical protein
MSEVNPYLPQPFVKDSDDLEAAATETLAAQLDPGREVGLLQIVNSPWNEELAVLAVTGTTDKGVHLATQALLQPVHRLKGNVAVIDLASDETDPISVYSVDTRPSPSPDQPKPNEAHGSNIEVLPEGTHPAIDVMLLVDRWWK